MFSVSIETQTVGMVPPTNHPPDLPNGREIMAVRRVFLSKPS
ncbi:MAG: hypothetical protein ACAH95_04890 [Fimbriimonas sp.]